MKLVIPPRIMFCEKFIRVKPLRNKATPELPPNFQFPKITIYDACRYISYKKSLRVPEKR
jgi:hypothetical protein